jgi:hypothetical protein
MHISTMRMAFVGSGIALALAVLAGCSPSNHEGLPGTGPASPGDEPTPTPGVSMGFDQVDRTAIPAVATLFIDPLGDRIESESDPKNAFNRGAPDAIEDFVLGIRTALRALRSSDDNPDNDYRKSEDMRDPALPRVSIDTAVAILAPDVLTVNLDGTKAGLFGVEFGVPGAFGGRTLAGDVVDAGLQVVVFPGAGPSFVSDYVDSNDTPFQANFPYTGLPHTP